MTDPPAVLLTATIWTYWFGVGLLIVRARHRTHRLPGVVPEQRLEQFMWTLWLPLVAAWMTLPYLALARNHGFAAVPAFARDDPGYAALRWIAAVGAIACLLLTSLCWSHMGRHWRMAVVLDADAELITSGPFRYVRHPIYTLSMLLMICSALVIPTAPMLLIAAVHLLLMHLKARIEERHLLRVHGKAYRGYAARTGRFLPKLG